MSLETDIRAALATALGANVGGVSEGALPQGSALPWVTFNRITTPRQHAFGSGNPIVSSKPRFQLDVWTLTPASRDAVLPLLIATVCALPYDVTIADQKNTHEAETGYWRSRLDVKVAHGGA